MGNRSTWKATAEVQKKSESGVNAEEFSKPMGGDGFKVHTGEQVWQLPTGLSILFAAALSPAAGHLSFGLRAGLRLRR